jgi:hypothetical protein
MSTPTRTYRGRAVDELIPRIQAELGPEAIIVRRRDGLTGGILGFFQHPFVEIEAMPGGPRIDVYDEDHSAEPTQSAAAIQPPPERRPAAGEPPAPVAPPAPAPAPALSPFYTREPASPHAYGSAYVTAHLAALARADRSKVGQLTPIPEPPRERPAPGADFQELIPRDLPPPGPRALSEAEYAPEPYAPAPRAPAPERRRVAPDRSKIGQHTRARAGVEKTLRGVGISEELARELIEKATAHTLALAPRSGLAQAVRVTLAQCIPVAPPLPASGAAIVVIGAGGAGKTTCCATLLAAYRTSSTLPARFATLTRGSERGELQMILSPQIMKPTPANAPRALRALQAARTGGLAVIDTPQLSPVDRAGIRELARLLVELEPERVVVALPATLGATAAAQLLTALSPLGANALAVTHAEETDQIGVAVEVACTFGLAPEFLLDRARSGGWRLSRTDPTGLAAKLLP